MIEQGYQAIHCVTRRDLTAKQVGVTYHQLDSNQHQGVKAWCEAHKSEFQLVICTIGYLHQGESMPEKKLEDIDPVKLQQYFNTNTIIPATWLKFARLLFNPKLGGKLVFSLREWVAFQITALVAGTDTERQNLP